MQLKTVVHQYTAHYQSQSILPSIWLGSTPAGASSCSAAVCSGANSQSSASSSCAAATASSSHARTRTAASCDRPLLLACNTHEDEVHICWRQQASPCTCTAVAQLAVFRKTQQRCHLIIVKIMAVGLVREVIVCIRDARADAELDQMQWYMNI
eukprot:15814-Heterococcus_DN1.PRE.1